MDWNSHDGKAKSKANCDKRSIIGLQKQKFTMKTNKKESDKMPSKDLKKSSNFLFF